MRINRGNFRGNRTGHRIGVQHTPLATGRTKMDACKTQWVMRVMCQHSVWVRNAKVVDYKPLDVKFIIGITSVMSIVGYMLDCRGSLCMPWTRTVWEDVCIILLILKPQH